MEKNTDVLEWAPIRMSSLKTKQNKNPKGPAQ